MKKYKVAIVGATGLVGRTVMQVFNEKNLPVESFRLICKSKLSW